ncbi:RNB domain-containing ribonuclease, partial [Cryobacterium sp. 10C2]
MNAILAEYGFPLSFPAEVERDAEEIPSEISAEEVAKRRDFRDVLTFTIDPFDAKDFDDALSFKKLDNGNYEVGVH